MNKIFFFIHQGKWYIFLDIKNWQKKLIIPKKNVYLSYNKHVKKGEWK